MNLSHEKVPRDQARHLRDLVRQAAQETSPTRSDRGNSPFLVVVVGAKGGVGVTTFTLRLAQAAARQKGQTLAVDASPRQADLAQLAGVPLEDERGTLVDVLTGRCSVEKAIRPLNDRLCLLASAGAPGGRLTLEPDGLELLLNQLDRWAGSGDLIIVDAGQGLTSRTETLWRRADRTLLLTTADELSVINAYATLKQAASQGLADAVELLVNRSSNAGHASKIHRRVDETCQRFLARSVRLAGWAPEGAPSDSGEDDFAARLLHDLNDARALTEDSSLEAAPV